MKLSCSFIVVFIFCTSVSYTAPVDDKDTNKDAKSAFGPAFDEIVVESHLTVRRKSNGRQGRNQNTTTEASTIIKTKREIRPPNFNAQINHKPLTNRQNVFSPSLQKQFGGSASATNSQSQASNFFGPLGRVGASASSSQSQNFLFGPNGVIGAAGFSGTQQYTFNGQTIDIAFGSGFSTSGQNQGSGAVVTITGPDGKKRPLNP